MHAVFATHDVLCSPTMATVAPVAPPGWATPYADSYMGTNFTFIANSTGCPAASVPCGLVDGLPVGLQIIGPPGDEATVLTRVPGDRGARPRASTTGCDRQSPWLIRMVSCAPMGTKPNAAATACDAGRRARHCGISPLSRAYSAAAAAAARA